ncbi:hypothetical protein OROHE_007873 [Orobanche hederae]
MVRDFTMVKGCGEIRLRMSGRSDSDLEFLASGWISFRLKLTLGFTESPSAAEFLHAVTFLLEKECLYTVHGTVKLGKSELDEAEFSRFHSNVEHGDLVGVSGFPVDVTKKVSNVIEKAVSIAKSTNKKQPMPYIPTITNYTQLWWIANVVVAHAKEGIEAVHLASGRTLCKLHLQEGSLHADINVDGILDHVQVLHRGQHRHGARATTAGNRVNLLLWCRRVQKIC